MTPLIIVKTRKGYAVVPYLGEMPTINLGDIEVFEGLTGRYGGFTDGVIGALREHFEPPEVVEGSPE